MMKKRIGLISLFIVLIELFGCSGTRAKSEDQIRQDIEVHYLWQDLNVNTTSFSVEKRQTNQDAKEDIVYITMTGENDGYTTEQFFIATYHLYNEGWILDNLENNSDISHFSTVTPTKGVDTDKIQELLGTFAFQDHGSFDMPRVEVDPSPVEGEQYLSNNYGQDVYTVYCKYYYEIVTEVVQFPMVFTFGYIGPEVGYGWSGYVDTENAVRSLELNDGILGEWEDSDWESPFYAYVDFSDIEGNSCWCDFSSYTYNGSYYITDIKNYSGSVTLQYSLSKKTGNIHNVELKFDSDVGALKCVSGEYLTMQAKSFAAGGYVTSHRELEFHKNMLTAHADSFSDEKVAMILELPTKVYETYMNAVQTQDTNTLIQLLPPSWQNDEFTVNVYNEMFEEGAFLGDVTLKCISTIYFGGADKDVLDTSDKELYEDIESAIELMPYAVYLFFHSFSHYDDTTYGCLYIVEMNDGQYYYVISHSSISESAYNNATNDFKSYV